MGDEVRRTQRGNNNAYCQDNEISWFDWSLLEAHADIHRFVKKLVHFRLSLDIFRGGHGLSLTQFLRQAQLQWHGVELRNPDWSYNSHTLAFTVQDRTGFFHLILNAYWEPLEFEIPSPPEHSPNGWRRVIDTSLDAPDDFCQRTEAPPVEGWVYQVQPRSVVLLVADRLSEAQP
jgi:glycogen operon protein